MSTPTRKGEEPTSIPVDITVYDEEESIYRDDDSLLSSTASLTDSIYDYRKLHGRTFQVSKTTEYWGPNDEQQNEALDVNHHWITMVLGDKLYLAPIGDDPKKILDIGTGTGIWAIDMANKYPSAEIIGTDISPIQPSWVPTNVSFQIDDAQQDWTWKANTFDLIHTRNMEGCISDWPALYAQAFTHLKPGGWYEDVAFDIHTRSDSPLVKDNPDHIFNRWSQFFMMAGEKMGKSFCYVRNCAQRQRMEEAGFVNVVEKKFNVPVGGWSSNRMLKTVGLYNGLFIDQSLEGFALFVFKNILGFGYDEIMALVNEMRTELRNLKNTPYYQLYVVYGQKPEDTVQA